MNGLPSLILAHNWSALESHTTRLGSFGAVTTGSVRVYTWDTFRFFRLMARPASVAVSARPCEMFNDLSADFASW